MCQQEVQKILKKQKDWILTKDLAKIMGKTNNQLWNSLNKMFKYGEVDRKMLNVNDGFMWRLKA